MKRKPWYRWTYPIRMRTGRTLMNRPPTYAAPKTIRGTRSRRAFVVMALLTLLAVSLAYGYYNFDRRILPLALASVEMRLKTTINDVIHTEVRRIIGERGVTAADFYIQQPEPNGGNVLAVNTVLVNDVCNAAALAISERLSTLPQETVSMPLGMATGLDTLANIGPYFTFRLSPTGNALVDYDTRFDSVGINQVHFEVWLTVVSTIRVINPVQSSTVTVTRDVSLVDTVISGVVPDTYVNWDGAAR